MPCMRLLTPCHLGDACGKPEGGFISQIITQRKTNGSLNLGFDLKLPFESGFLTASVSLLCIASPAEGVE